MIRRVLIAVRRLWCFVVVLFLLFLLLLLLPGHQSKELAVCAVFFFSSWWYLFVKKNRVSALLTELSTAVAFFAFRVLQDSSLALFRLGENCGVVSMFRDDSYIFPPRRLSYVLRSPLVWFASGSRLFEYFRPRYRRMVRTGEVFVKIHRHNFWGEV